MMNYPHRSFNSNRAHGTMLPSKAPLVRSDFQADNIMNTGAMGAEPDGGDEPPRVSNGSHITVTNRNRLAADKHQKARAWRQNLQIYWES